MKIGLVSPYDYSIPGGVTNHISHLAYHFQKMGHEVRVLAPCASNGLNAAPEDVIPFGNVTHIPHNGSIASITLSWQSMPRVRATLEKERFDVIHVHEPMCPLLPWMVLYLSTTMNVASFDAYYERSFWYRVGGWSVPALLVRKLQGKMAVKSTFVVLP